ncbi:MAG: metabolite traffic protein EboE [Balneolaceae bacterium]|nr:metabolite traffic protein EboE [Balneolaceae bacterium]
MQPKSHTGLHLSYCSNVHPGESWPETLAQLKKHVPELKKRLSPDQPFGVGLRLSAAAAQELLAGHEMDQFKSWLKDEDLYVFTLNGFPYGSFHRERVKDEVYKPDWQSEKRFKYTANLINILAELLPDNVDGSISTSPISYKYWGQSEEEIQQIIAQSSVYFADLADIMAKIYRDNQTEIHIAIEPEPDCLIENSKETIDYFTNHLFPEGSKHLAEKLSISRTKAEEILRRHIGVCYDTCHFALEYEHPSRAIDEFRAAGIRISKTQISAALKVALSDSTSEREKISNQLQKFVEPVYLHQTIERHSDGSLHQYRDLPQALEKIHTTDAVEWRIHFHVPVFHREFNGLHSTQDEITESLNVLLDSEICTHYEIETYTWEVLPDHLKADLTDSIEREFRWTTEVFSRNAN